MALSASSSLRAAPARGGLRRGMVAPVAPRRLARVQAAVNGASYDDENAAFVQKVTTEEFDAVVGSGVTLVDCFTDWCGPCKLVAPYYSQLAAAAAAEAPGAVRFVKFDCQSDPKRSSAMGIKALPTFLAFKDGVEVGRMTGSNKEEMKRFVDEHRAAAAAVPAEAVAA